MIRIALVLAAVWIAVNGLLFGTYRLLFLIRGGAVETFRETARVLLSGLRLDLALFGFELFGVGLLTLLLRRLRVGRVLQWLGGLTALHGFICVANDFSFAERGQNAGDLLLPYITSPYQVYLAVLPFAEQHWFLLMGLGVGMGFALWFGTRLARCMEAERPPLDLWADPRALAVTVGLVLLPLMLTWQPLIKRKITAHSKGLTVVFANSKFYTHFSDFLQNEAVINPLFEFVGVQIPAALHQTVRYRQTEAEALKLWEQDNGRGADARYPLLRTISGSPSSQIENVVIIQVEGLTGSVLQQERNGRLVMPYLCELAQKGIYFSNTFQNANFTSGGVFSTATSVPKATWEETTRRFAGHEMHGFYGSLAHLLGPTNYTHVFCEGFRQSGDDFLSFMAYQGNKVLNYDAFRSRLGGKGQLADADAVLGIHDGYVLQELADMVVECPTRFTAHLMSCTTHSPWATPPSFKAPFAEQELNTFAYLDGAIQAFVKRIEQTPALRQKTLLIVLDDHTSLTFGKDLLERLRIPLIFYAPGLPRLEQAGTIWASQVDVLPTVLGLMKGEHRYAGMGRNLLDPHTAFTGVVSGTRDTGYFLTEDWVLQYHPFGGRPRLFAVSNGLALPQNRADDQPQLVSQLTREYLSRVELSRRLGLERRVFPIAAETQHLGVMARDN